MSQISERTFSAKDGAVWIQPDGPNQDVEFLGCHDVDDVTVRRETSNIVIALLQVENIKLLASEFLLRTR